MNLRAWPSFIKSGVRLHRDDSCDRQKVKFTWWGIVAVLHLTGRYTNVCLMLCAVSLAACVCVCWIVHASLHLGSNTPEPPLTLPVHAVSLPPLVPFSDILGLRCSSNDWMRAFSVLACYWYTFSNFAHISFQSDWKEIYTAGQFTCHNAHFTVRCNDASIAWKCLFIRIL